MLQQLDAVFLFEFIYATACIDELLLTGKERMAARANLNTKILLNGAGFERIAASASNSRKLIIRMNVSFHRYFTSFRPDSIPSNQSYMDT